MYDIPFICVAHGSRVAIAAVNRLAWASCQIRKRVAGCACAGNAGNTFPSQRISDPDMHHGTCVTHVPRCMPGSLTSGFLWSQWRGNVPDIPGACATRHFTYLVRGPWQRVQTTVCGIWWIQISSYKRSCLRGNSIGKTYWKKIHQEVPLHHTSLQNNCHS